MTQIAAAQLNPAERTVDVFHAIFESTSGLYRILHVVKVALTALQEAFGYFKPLTISIKQIVGAIAVIDFSDILSLVEYWVGGEFLRDIDCDRFASLAGNSFLGGAILTGAALFLTELGFGNLAAAAAACASVPVLGSVVGAVAAVGLGPISLVFASAAYFCFGVNSLQTLLKSDIEEERIKAILDMISNFFDSALCAALLVPGLNIAALLVLGGIAKGMALASFIYGHCTKEAVENAKLRNMQAENSIDETRQLIEVTKYSNYKVETKDVFGDEKSSITIDPEEKVIRVNVAPNFICITHNRGT